MFPMLFFTVSWRVFSTLLTVVNCARMFPMIEIPWECPQSARAFPQ